VLERLVDAYPEQVQYVYRHFPLTSIHDNAHKAAEASEAAGRQGAFWEYHDLLFERISVWSGLEQSAARDYFVDLAEELGLDTDRFASELDSGMYADYVSTMEQEALGLGINSTPSAIIDGQLAQGLPQDFAVWDNYVSGQLQLKLLEERQYDAPPAMAIDVEATYLARVEMESGEEFVIELLPQSAPQTVNSFIFLAEEGWFDGVTFHRVLPGFVAQTGDPTGTGFGGPGYTIPNEIDPTLSHDQAGMVAMANSGPDTNGSQWYITYADVSQLDGGYTIFGRVVEGLDVVGNITPRDPAQGNDLPPGDKIVRITIESE
jgi:cyclophilin family peptidyl-prolyl cis-trans isomerase